MAPNIPPMTTAEHRMQADIIASRFVAVNSTLAAIMERLGDLAPARIQHSSSAAFMVLVVVSPADAPQPIAKLLFQLQLLDEYISNFMRTGCRTFFE